MLDENGNEIELKNEEEDDDFRQGFRDEEIYSADEQEIESSGYSIEDAETEGDDGYFDDYEEAEEDDFVDITEEDE